MIGYILCENGMIYKGIKYKENGVYFRVDGFIVFLKTIVKKSPKL